MTNNKFSKTENDFELEWENYYLKDVSQHDYNPIISDDVITLSMFHKEDVETLNNMMFATFNIILNKTKEAVGCISFNYYYDNKDKTTIGNATYVIGRSFQNQGYATRALKLLVNFLKNNNFKGDKDLYFWVSYYNEFSKKVILNNGGEVLSGGDLETKSPYTLRIKI